MKFPSMVIAIGWAGAGSLFAADGKFLNVAILTLPERYLADVPMGHRTRLLMNLSGAAGADDRLDYEHGWLHWVYDGPREDSPGATSMFWLKLLPVKEGVRPYVFVHMAKPFANGAEPAVNQTFVLEYKGSDGWVDVTARVMPGMDLTMHFRPRRTEPAIEVAPYEKFERRDGGGAAYRFGKRELDLIWEDGAFSPQMTAEKQFTPERVDEDE